MGVLHEACAALSAVAIGPAWNAERIPAATQGVRDAVGDASSAERQEALQLLVARLESSSYADADGAAYVALAAGMLIEAGAPPEGLGAALLRRLPSVLRGARNFATLCLDASSSSNADGVDDEEIVTHVDEKPIFRDVFASLAPKYPAEAASLARLWQWVLPSIAALTRSRPLLAQAVADAKLRLHASMMSRSSAGALHTLLGVQLDVSAIVLHVPLGRGFRMVLDGIASNFDLRALVEDALLERGLPGKRNSPHVLAVIRGDAEQAQEQQVRGVFNLYTYRAAHFDLNAPFQVPLKDWVWNEGVPDDVPRIDGQRVLLVGPPQPERTWSLGRLFPALRQKASVEEELPASEVARWLRRCREG